MINHDEASKWAKKETIIGILLGLVMGVPATWHIRDSLYKDNKENLLRQITDLKEEKNNLDSKKSGLEKELATCQTDHKNLINSIRQDYVTREKFNRCMQANSQFLDENKRIKSENSSLLSQSQIRTSCLQRQQHLQKQLDVIRDELRSETPRNSLLYSKLTEQQILTRREQQQQLVDQLNKLNCQ